MPSYSIRKQREQDQRAIALRDELLAECGWPVQKRQKLLCKAINRLNRQLDATKYVDGTEVIDNQAVLRAAEAVIDLEGVSRGKAQEGGSSGPVTITLNASWFQPAPTTGSGSGQVVEGDPPKLLE